MKEKSYRLGDTIDDYCPRCKLLLNHAIASLVEGQVVKVICQTCHSEHPYRRGKGSEKKAPTRRAALFEQVLAKAAPAAQPPPLAGQRKKATPPARYISRHKARPPRGNL